jgi:hypothetical protein
VVIGSLTMRAGRMSSGGFTMSESFAKSAESPVAELDLNKLLGFRRIAGFGSDAATLARALDAAHTKIGVEGCAVDAETDGVSR